jgi:hypothetical protein
VFLKNYTSTVPVSETIRRIESVLIRCGVSGITKEYTGTNGTICAITFKIQPDPKMPGFTVRLPADKEKALDALWIDYADGCDLTKDGKEINRWSNPHKRKKRQDFAEQAERTAWKIIQDWVEVQMSMIQMKQAETVEVFLPYIYDGETTVFGRIKASGFRALLTEHTESNQ